MAESANNKFTCACADEHRSACQKLPFFESPEGNDYCVLHYPGADKIFAFRYALGDKLEEQDYDFRGVWFPEAVDFTQSAFNEATNFGGATFSAIANFTQTEFRSDAEFSKACFNAGAIFTQTEFKANANFNEASFLVAAEFVQTQFSASANFNKANFSAPAKFIQAKFSAITDFGKARFNSPAEFIQTQFNATADFQETSFNAPAEFALAEFNADAVFHRASFKDYVHISGSIRRKVFGEKPRLDFQFARIEKPERVSFHTLILRPHWFINVDSRKFEFVDVDWFYRLKEELQNARENGVSAPHRLLAITYRQLADNAEANHRYHEASRFRYNAFEARRVEKFHGFVPWRLDWWYWLASGYGESVGRAFLIFVALLALFAYGYMWVGFEQNSKITNSAVAPSTVTTVLQPDTVGKPLEWKDAMVYSLNVSILQKPEPKPLTRCAKLLVALETIFGPAQAALLALAVRRRFMR